MASVVKKYKRQVKSAYKAAVSEGKASKTIRTWSFNEGDLVKTPDGIIAIILSVENNGWAELMSQEGKTVRKVTKLRKFKDEL